MKGRFGASTINLQALGNHINVNRGSPNRGIMFRGQKSWPILRRTSNIQPSTDAKERKNERDHTLVICITQVLSTCPLHTNSGCGKERRILIGPWGPAKAAPVRNYLEVYWPCAGRLSAVNAIGTQLCDPISSGLTRWRMAV